MDLSIGSLVLQEHFFLILVDIVVFVDLHLILVMLEVAVGDYVVVSLACL
jgi:hypothetical protein